MTDTKEYTYTMKLKVRDYEVDSQGIVNNANYLHYLEHTRHEFCATHGISFRDMQREGIDPVVSRIEIDYLAPLGLGEEMTSCLRLERKGARFIFFQDIFRERDGVQCIRAKVSIVALEGGRLTRGEKLAEAFHDFLTEE